MSGLSKYRALGSILLCVILLWPGISYALALNPRAAESAMMKLDIEASIVQIESVFKKIISSALAREEYPALIDVNTASVSSKRDRERFLDMAAKLSKDLEENTNWIDDIEEILWMVPTEQGIILCTPQDMKNLGETSASVVIKYSPEYEFENDKFHALILSQLRKNRIVSLDKGRITVWLMPTISETQKMIEDTVKIIRESQERRP